MLEKPDLPDERLLTAVCEQYGLPVERVEFLPLGADRDTAVYRLEASDGSPYFLKLRRGSFDETAVLLPAWLHAQGLAGIIAPLETRAGALWGRLDEYSLILSPFVTGQNGYQTALTERQWAEFGRTFRRVHGLRLPPALDGRIPRETFSPAWRDLLRGYLDQPGGPADDPLTAELHAVLAAEREVILDLLERSDRYARQLLSDPPAFVLCHADLHAGNLLVDPGGALYVVDWDAPLLAPKERDLMSIGAGLMGNRLSPEEEAARFYRGYGPVELDPRALTYYRCQRIIEDLAVYYQEISGPGQGDADRRQGLRYLKSNFDPGGTIELALGSDRG